MREIKNRQESIRGIESRAVRTGLLTNPPRQLVTIPDDDFEWLIEQAERAIDYDNKLISIEDNKQYVSELLEQNKRYREELDVIGEVINSVDDADEINDRILKSMEEDE